MKTYIVNVIYIADDKVCGNSSTVMHQPSLIDKRVAFEDII